MITLYGNPYSRANRVRWTLQETSARYREQTISLGADGTRSPGFLEINPNGHVPVIDDGELRLFESVPISLYLARRYSPIGLYVQGAQDEARLQQWAMWAVTELERQIETASLHLTWLPPSARSADRATHAQAEAWRCLGILSNALQASGHLVAQRFTVADLIVTEVLTNLVHARMDLTPFPTVARYVALNLSRPAARRAFNADILQPFLPR